MRRQGRRLRDRPPPRTGCCRCRRPRQASEAGGVCDEGRRAGIGAERAERGSGGGEERGARSAARRAASRRGISPGGDARAAYHRTRTRAGTPPRPRGGGCRRNASRRVRRGKGPRKDEEGEPRALVGDVDTQRGLGGSVGARLFLGDEAERLLRSLRGAETLEKPSGRGQLRDIGERLHVRARHAGGCGEKKKMWDGPPSMASKSIPRPRRRGNR